MKFVILLSALLVGNASLADDCKLTATIVSENLQLDWNEFDQTMGQGHRELALKGCFLEAANLIDAYNLQHRSQLEPSRTRILYFHAGQMYAYTSLNEIAASRMMESLNPKEAIRPELNWNDYVQASVAFLRGDKDSLKAFRDKLASGKPTQGNQMNLRVVDNLIKCFGHPYSWAYGNSGRCGK